MPRKDMEYDGKRHSVDLALAKIEDATAVLHRKKPLTPTEQSFADHVVMQLGEALGIHVQVPMRADMGSER